MSILTARPAPRCLLGNAGPPLAAHGHDPDVLVEIGSLTKVITGTLMLRLAEAGTLDPDEPVDRRLPVPPGTGITPRNLAEHTSGLPRLPPLSQSNPLDPYAAFDADALTAVLERLPELAELPAGERELYSNFGYAVLGAVLVEAGGEDYESLLRRHVLQPLGIDADQVAVAPPAESRLTARSWLRTPRTPWTMDGAILPAGGLWATVRATAAITTGLLLDGTLGDPAPTWQVKNGIHWHNGATRDSFVFAAAEPATGAWVVAHQLGGSRKSLEQHAVEHLRTHRSPSE
jgi:D-alanyl-D-alanine-carboxypeptidase/D-alanyl-D-alanine-endopeptidase